MMLLGALMGGFVTGVVAVLARFVPMWRGASPSGRAFLLRRGSGYPDLRDLEWREAMSGVGMDEDA